MEPKRFRYQKRTKMKKLVFILLAVLCAAVSVQAKTARVTINFTGPAQAGVEYFAQQRSGTTTAPVWTEVVKGPATPLVVTIPDVVPGVYVYRVLARLIASPTSVTEPTNEAVGVVLPAQPTGATVTFVFTD